MESASQPLSVGSFSYSWLVNLTPTSHPHETRPGDSFRDYSSLDASISDIEANSFIEMDPRMPPSQRFFTYSPHDFNFDFPVSPPSSLAFVHADQLFSNGYLVPLFIDPVKINQSNFNPEKVIPPSSDSVAAKHINSSAGGDSDHDKGSNSLRKCKRLSKKVLQKYLNFLIKPLYQRMRRHNSKASSKSDQRSFERKRSQSVKNWVHSEETISPRISVAYSADAWRKSCDSESSIHEAVLHCKRSIGKP